MADESTAPAPEQKTPNPKDFKTVAEYEAACARQRAEWRRPRPPAQQQ